MCGKIQKSMPEQTRGKIKSPVLRMHCVSCHQWGKLGDGYTGPLFSATSCECICNYPQITFFKKWFRREREMDSECEEVLGIPYPILFCLCSFLCMHEDDMIKISKSEEPIQ